MQGVPQDLRAAAARALLWVTEGLAAYVNAFRKAFRSPQRTGWAGRIAMLFAPTVRPMCVFGMEQKWSTCGSRDTRSWRSSTPADIVCRMAHRAVRKEPRSNERDVPWP